jgi:hypothetical protein
MSLAIAIKGDRLGLRNYRRGPWWAWRSTRRRPHGLRSVRRLVGTDRHEAPSHRHAIRWRRHGPRSYRDVIRSPSPWCVTVRRGIQTVRAPFRRLRALLCSATPRGWKLRVQFGAVAKWSGSGLQNPPAAAEAPSNEESRANDAPSAPEIATVPGGRGNDGAIDAVEVAFAAALTTASSAGKCCLTWRARRPTGTAPASGEADRLRVRAERAERLVAELRRANGEVSPAA